MNENYAYETEDYGYETREKSTFVTVVAIIFIVLSILGLLALIPQMFLQSVILQRNEVAESIREQIENGTMPPIAGLFYTHQNLFIMLSFVRSIVSLVASIGLLNRKNWARILFIIVMSLAIARQIFGIIFSWTIVPNTQDIANSNGNNVMYFLTAIRIFTSCFVIGFIILYGWIIYKLLSEKIRREFIPETQPYDYMNNQEETKNDNS